MEFTCVHHKLGNPFFKGLECTSNNITTCREEWCIGPRVQTAGEDSFAMCDEIHGKTIEDDKLCANSTFWNQLDCGGPNCPRGSPYYYPCERCQGRYSGECVDDTSPEIGDVE